MKYYVLTQAGLAGLWLSILRTISFIANSRKNILFIWLKILKILCIEKLYINLKKCFCDIFCSPFGIYWSERSSSSKILANSRPSEIGLLLWLCRRLGVPMAWPHLIGDLSRVLALPWLP